MRPLNFRAGKYNFKSITEEQYDDKTFIVASGFGRGFQSNSNSRTEVKYNLGKFLDSVTCNEEEKLKIIGLLINGNVLVINKIIELPVIGQIGKRTFHFDWDIELSQEFQNQIYDAKSFEDSFLIDDNIQYESEQIELEGYLTDDSKIRQTEIDHLNTLLSIDGDTDTTMLDDIF
ncbi:hypothetical protein [Pedobacter sp. AJM]|uniref:hypothetical protein n=1 Tax=Pedobacter sp. AJM TaxID=2003629 RepID=UPI000B4A73B6|nr:hypothetical protein [Pedobacter sp. AJM]OWK71428.1 hypothetical protein CBW18_10260 [Pedobacter sp. AJM]